MKLENNFVFRNDEVKNRFIDQFPKFDFPNDGCFYISNDLPNGFDLNYFFKTSAVGDFAGHYTLAQDHDEIYFPSTKGKYSVVSGNSSYHDGLLLSGILRIKSLADHWDEYLKEEISLIPTPRFLGTHTEPRPMLFLDRDGIINEDIGYAHKTSDLKVVDKIVDIIKLANEKNYLVTVLTNQSGIGRGYYTEDDAKMANAFIDNKLKSENAIVDKWYYCPFHGEGTVKEYTYKSYLRKPHPGMALLACQDFSVNIHSSIMIGDKMSDRLNIPGLTSILVKGNYQLDSNEADVVENHQQLLSRLKEIL